MKYKKQLYSLLIVPVFAILVLGAFSFIVYSDRIANQNSKEIDPALYEQSCITAMDEALNKAYRSLYQNNEYYTYLQQRKYIEEIKWRIQSGNKKRSVVVVYETFDVDEGGKYGYSEAVIQNCNLVTNIQRINVGHI